MSDTKSLVAKFQARLEEMRTAAIGRGDIEQPNVCERCDGTKWIYIQDGAVSRTTRCPDCTIGAADPFPPSVPFEFQKASLGTYDPLPGNASALRYAKKFFEVTVGDLYLWGGIGTGKTRLAISVLNEWYRQHKTGLFVRVAQLLYELQPSQDDAKRERLYASVCAAPVLVLDDVGSERDEASDFTRRTMLMLYEERSDRGHRTIWTSNLDLQKLGQAQQDERLVSRISHRCSVVQLTTTDQRFSRRRS